MKKKSNTKLDEPVLKKKKRHGTESEKAERRICRRFKVPGATVHYTVKEVVTAEEKDEKPVKWDEEYCPVSNLSCGGVKFNCKNSLTINSAIFLKIFIPGDKTPLVIRGEIRWLSTEEARESCHVGVQFYPYGEKEGQNYPGLMVKLLALEQKFSSQEESDIEKYEIDN